MNYFIHPLRPDAVLQQSNWMGYVAVATDDGKAALGRRDILIAWRGTVRPAEWVKNFDFLFVKAPLLFGQDSDPLVHKGFYDMYTAVNPDPVLKGVSARDQVRLSFLNCSFPSSFPFSISRVFCFSFLVRIFDHFFGCSKLP